MRTNNLSKRFLFAAINDSSAYEALKELASGEEAHISLGVGFDEMSRPVDLDVIMRSCGDVINPIATGGMGNALVGECVTVSVKGIPVDIIITNCRQAYYLNEQYHLAGVDWRDYDITVVKLGYIWPELKKDAKFYVMSLTDGFTPQNVKLLDFKQIVRPIYPIDEM